MEDHVTALVPHQLRSLKARALGVGFTGLVACSGAIVQAATVLNELYETWMRQNGLPGFDIPLSVSVLFVYELFQAITLFLLVAAVAGFSLGAFPRHRARLVFLIPALLLVLTAWWVPPASRWMHLAPSTLDRHVQQGRYDEAEHIIRDLSLPKDTDSYLRAQIALRVGDAAMLRSLGELLLTNADNYVYQIDRTHDPMFPSQIPAYSPEVIYAIDRALNGQPETQVGMEWERRNSSGEELPYWLESLARALISVAMVFLGSGALRVWNGMRQRISRIGTAIRA